MKTISKLKQHVNIHRYWCVLIYIWRKSNVDLSTSKVDDMYSDMLKSNKAIM